MTTTQASHAPATMVSGILTFILADMIVFAMLFVGFMVERGRQLPIFDQATATLNLAFGIANTLILVSSGLFMVLAVSAAKRGEAAIFRRWLVGAFVIGAGFGALKLIEYSQKISAGITMLTNDFYMFYYALTGAHFLHFLAGMVAISAIWYKSLNEPVQGPLLEGIESIGLYWHMVDLLWLVIFPLLYLLRP